MIGITFYYIFRVDKACAIKKSVAEKLVYVDYIEKLNYSSSVFIK